jgi:hypothetical protein
MRNKNTFFLMLLFLFVFVCEAHQKDTSEKSLTIIEAEVVSGYIVPNFPNYPAHNPMFGIWGSVGKIHHNSTFSEYYNNPQTGLSFGYINLGNSKVFGEQFFLLPYLSLNTSKEKLNSWWFRFGLGVAYFTTFYDSIVNVDNVAIGSSFTWAFQAALHKKWHLSNTTNFKIGGHYLHASNGHTQLPNFGLNSAAVSVALEFFPNKNNKSNHFGIKQKQEFKKQWFIQATQGVGMHELGATAHPIGGSKKEVYASKISVGAIFANHIKINSGFAYRFYQQYYDDILKKSLLPYFSNPKSSASNLYYFIGSEFLFGHVGINIEGGLNIYKPYFNYFYPHYENSSNFDFWLKKLFCTQLGLNFYAFNTQKFSKFNVFAGVHLNANFGQADFTAASAGAFIKL